MKKIMIKNAVLRKDMMLDMKKPKVAIIMLIFNAGLALVALPFLAFTTMFASAYDYGVMEVSYRTLIIMYMVFRICSTGFKNALHFRAIGLLPKK